VGTGKVLGVVLNRRSPNSAQGFIPNPFLALAERQIANPVKARMKAAQKRALKKVADDRATLFKVYKQWQAGRREALLAGPYGDAFRDVMVALDGVTLADIDNIHAMVIAGPWRTAPADIRFELLNLIDAVLIELRERADLPPFNDPLPGDQPDIFQHVKEALAC
jgi:hypothetical protein